MASSEAVQLLAEIRDTLKQILETQFKKKRQPREPKTNTELHVLAQIWNEKSHETLPKVVGISPNSKRFRIAQDRWREKPDKQYWEQTVEIINKSEFCLGKNDRHWRADFEFFTRPDTHYRVREGKYQAQMGVKKERKIVGYIDLPDGVREPIWG